MLSVVPVKQEADAKGLFTLISDVSAQFRELQC
jgi:hypothetical protein